MNEKNQGGPVLNFFRSSVPTHKPDFFFFFCSFLALAAFLTFSLCHEIFTVYILLHILCQYLFETS